MRLHGVLPLAYHPYPDRAAWLCPANPPEDPVVDGHTVLGESAALEQLVDAVNGQRARYVGTQGRRHLHLHRVRCHYLRGRGMSSLPEGTRDVVTT